MMKSPNKTAKTLAKITALLGVFFAFLLVVSPAFAGVEINQDQSVLYGASAAIAFASATFFEIWRRIANQRQLESFVHNIRTK